MQDKHLTPDRRDAIFLVTRRWAGLRSDWRWEAWPAPTICSGRRESAEGRVDNIKNCPFNNCHPMRNKCKQ